MPFDSVNRVVYGIDAITPEKWARSVFCVWLAAKLNDSEGAYYSILQLASDRPAFVSENGELAKAMYGTDKAPPVVGLMQGEVSSMIWWKNIDGIEYNGQRLDIVLDLDMGVRDITPNEDNIELERDDDSNLAGIVTDAVRQGFNELGAIGLNNINIDPSNEKQMAGNGDTQ